MFIVYGGGLAPSFPTRNGVRHRVGATGPQHLQASPLRDTAAFSGSAVLRAH